MPNHIVKVCEINPPYPTYTANSCKYSEMSFNLTKPRFEIDLRGVVQYIICSLFTFGMIIYFLSKVL